jgi:hypothetical protein
VYRHFVFEEEHDNMATERFTVLLMVFIKELFQLRVQSCRRVLNLDVEAGEEGRLLRRAPSDYT